MPAGRETIVNPRKVGTKFGAPAAKKPSLHQQWSNVLIAIMERSHQFIHKGTRIGKSAWKEAISSSTKEQEFENQLGKKPSVHPQRNKNWKISLERSHQYIHKGTRIGALAGKEGTSTYTKEQELKPQLRKKPSVHPQWNKNWNPRWQGS